MTFIEALARLLAIAILLIAGVVVLAVIGAYVFGIFGIEFKEDDKE